MSATYAQFLSDPLRRSVYLAEVHYGDPSNGSSGVLYFSTDKYGTEASDTPASQRYDARMAQGYDFSATAGNGDEGSGDEGIGTITGILPARRGGTLTLTQKLGDLDYLRNLTFDGRSVVIRHGGTSPRYGAVPYASFRTVFNGECAGQPLIGVDEVTLQLANRDARFEFPIQTRRYGGGSWCLLGNGSSYAVDCGTSSVFNFTSSAFTVEFRIYVEANPGAESTILNRASNNVDGWSIRLGTNGAIRFSTHQSGTSQTTASNPVTLNRWVHVAIVRSGTACTIYLDGVDSTASAGTHTNPTTASRNLYFLRNNAGTVFFAGFLDEVRIWNSALSLGVINSRANRQLAAVEVTSGLVGYWKLDDGTGTTCNDESATAAHGTLASASAWRPSLQGGEENAGALLPDVWGARWGVPPVLVDVASRVYQVHSGPINAIVGVFEGGNAITLDPSPGTTYTSLTTFLAATTAAGNYEVLSTDHGSFIRLGSNPSLPITVDIQGDKSGGTYRTRASDIWRYIVANRGPQPLADPADLDDSAFTTLRSAATMTVGIDYSTEISIAEVGNFLMKSVGASSWVNREGLLTCARFEGASAGTAVLDLTQNDIELGTLEPLDAGVPVWAVDLGYKRNGLVHATSDIASAVIGTSRWAFLLKEWRIVGITNPAVSSTYKGARKMTVETGISLWADAVVEAQRRLDLFPLPPQAFRLFCRERAIQLDRFDVVTLHFQDRDELGALQSRFGTAEDANFLVLAAEDDTTKGGCWLTLYREATS